MSEIETETEQSTLTGIHLVRARVKRLHALIESLDEQAADVVDLAWQTGRQENEDRAGEALDALVQAHNALLGVVRESTSLRDGGYALTSEQHAVARAAMVRAREVAGEVKT